MTDETKKTVSNEIGAFHDVYADTVYFIDNIVSQYAFYPEIIRVFREGNASIALKKKYVLKAIDEKWVNMIEDSLGALDTAIRHPSRFLEENEVILPIELTKNINSRSIKHLAQHTDMISKIEGDVITPSKLLNVFRDETIQTYENRFVNTLILRLFIFVNRRYEIALKEGNDEKNTSLDFHNNFSHGEVEAKIDFHVEIAEKPRQQEVLKNYTYTTDLWQRVVRLNNVCLAYMNSDFVEKMGKNYIRPPVMRTNALLKNKDLRVLLTLWEFIESYEDAGYSMLLQENLESIDEKYIKEMYSTMAMQYLIFRHSIRNEFEDGSTLASHLTEQPLRPRILDELPEVPEEETVSIPETTYPSADTGVPKPRQVTSDPSKYRAKRLNAYEKTVVEAIEIALEADGKLREMIRDE